MLPAQHALVPLSERLAEIALGAILDASSPQPMYFGCEHEDTSSEKTIAFINYPYVLWLATFLGFVHTTYFGGHYGHPTSIRSRY